MQLFVKNPRFIPEYIGILDEDIGLNLYGVLFSMSYIQFITNQSFHSCLLSIVVSKLSKRPRTRVTILINQTYSSLTDL